MKAFVPNAPSIFENKSKNTMRMMMFDVIHYWQDVKGIED
jgi:hypothetical protein